MIDVEVTHATRWLEFRHLTYVDPTGAERRWDMVGRATRSKSEKSKGIDAVCVFATLRKKGEEDSTLLVRQFRPPMNGETIELPAGLVDADEDPVVAALRELKEETGYVGTVTRMGNGTDATMNRICLERRRRCRCRPGSPTRPSRWSGWTWT